MLQADSKAGTVEVDPKQQLAAELERELVAEASATDRPADADGVQMHTLIPSLPIRQ
jgi:hypothetical protein